MKKVILSIPKAKKGNNDKFHFTKNIPPWQNQRQMTNWKKHLQFMWQTAVYCHHIQRAPTNRQGQKQPNFKNGPRRWIVKSERPHLSKLQMHIPLIQYFYFRNLSCSCSHTSVTHTWLFTAALFIMATGWVWSSLETSQINYGLSLLWKTICQKNEEAL